MAWKQLIAPNVAIDETAGWCLQYSRRTFGLPAVEPTAWDGWLNTDYKHGDRNFPQGVAHPVWFDWWGDVGAGRRRYGHVAVRTADGRIWSSPLSGVGRAWFNSVDDLVRAFGGGMVYVGWSEDISNARVIKEEVIMDAASLAALYQLGAIKHINGDDKFVKDNLGKEPLKVITDLLNSAAHKEVVASYHAAKSNATATPAIELKPGLYEVK